MMRRERRQSHPAPPLYSPIGSKQLDAGQLGGSQSPSWAQIINTPTTLAGYGVTDAYTTAEVDALFAALTPADLVGWPADAAGYLKSDGAGTLSFDPLTAADIDSGTFPGTSAYVIGGGGTLKVESTLSSLTPMSFRGYAAGDAFVCGMEIVDAIGAQYGSWAKASAGDANIYFQSYKGGMKYWARLGSIEFAPGGTTTKWTMDQTTFDLVAASGAMARLAASTTSKATLRIPHGAAPTTPTNGDMWTTTAGLFVRINGVTVGPLS